MAPSNFIRDWIKSNYLEIVSRLWVHHDADIKYVDIITKEMAEKFQPANSSAAMELAKPNFLKLIQTS